MQKRSRKPVSEITFTELMSGTGLLTKSVADSRRMPSQQYLQAMIGIAMKSQVLCNLPPASEQETLLKAAIWAEVLWPIVPEEDLQEAYETAFAQKKDCYPISVVDLKLGFESMQRVRGFRIEQDAVNAIRSCSLCDHHGLRKFDPDEPDLYIRVCDHVPVLEGGRA